jgi:hypothetical protein
LIKKFRVSIGVSNSVKESDGALYCIDEKLIGFTALLSSGEKKKDCRKSGSDCLKN